MTTQPENKLSRQTSTAEAAPGHPERCLPPVPFRYLKTETETETGRAGSRTDRRRTEVPCQGHTPGLESKHVRRKPQLGMEEAEAILLSRRGGVTGPPSSQSEGHGLLIVRAQLFLSSYAPLFLILAFRFDGTKARLVCALLAAVGFAYLLVVVGIVTRQAQPRRYPVAAVSDSSGEVAGYLATYLLPFVAVTSPTTGDLVGYGILAAVYLAIFLRSELAQINPTLYLLGMRVASVTINGTDRYLVCRRLPRPPTEVFAVRVAGLLIRKEPPQHGR